MAVGTATGSLFPHWDEGLSVGHAGLDHQHRDFFRQVTDVIACSETGALPELRAGVARLIAEMISHFDEEEEVINRTAYPHASSHAVEHRILLNMAQEVSGEVARSDNIPYLRLSIQHMAHLVLQHMRGSDALYGPYLGDIGGMA